MEKENPQKAKNKSSDGSGKSTENLVNAYRKMSPYLNVGYVWAATVIVFTLLGIYLDKKWGTSPWLTLAGALLGITGGFYQFIKTVMDLDKKT